MVNTTMKMMNPLKDIDKLVEILAKAERELIYLGPEPQIDSIEELAESIEIAEGFGLGSGLLEYVIEDIDGPPYKGFLDSSSRSIAYPGIRIFIGACYAKDLDRHVLVPTGLRTPYLAIQMGRKAIESLRVLLEGVAYFESPSGSLYDEGYKSDNIHDELRLRLENAVLNIMRSDKILIDGPIYPVQVAFSKIFGEEYREAFEKLYREREPHILRLIGVVKRLDQTFKLLRIPEIREEFTRITGRDIRAPDSVVVSRLAGDKRIHVMGIFRESFQGLEARYMIYVYVRTPAGPRVFRLETLNREELLRAAGYIVRNLSTSGLPVDIEIADRISKRLSASIYLALYLYGAPRLGLSHDENVKVAQVLGELRQ
jgi:hypothetical protein